MAHVGLLAKVAAPSDVAAVSCMGRTAIGEPMKGPLRPPGGVRVEASAIFLLLQGVVLTMPRGVARPMQGELGTASAARGISKAQASNCGGAACVTERQPAGALYAMRVDASGAVGGG